MRDFIRGVIGLAVQDTSGSGEVTAAAVGKSVRDVLIGVTGAAAVYLIDGVTDGSIQAAGVAGEILAWAVATGGLALLRRVIVSYAGVR